MTVTMARSSALRDFVRPDSRKAIVFLLMLALWAGGFEVQTWAFSKAGPKPPLYDLLSHVDLWTPSLLLYWPIVMIAALRPPLESLLFAVSGAVYALLLSGLLFFAHDRWGRRYRGLAWALFLGLPALAWSSAAFVMPRSIVGFVSGTMILTGLVAAVYAYLVVCLAVGATRALRRTNRPPAAPRA
jgi:hypothetical protein